MPVFPVPLTSITDPFFSYTCASLHNWLRALAHVIRRDARGRAPRESQEARGAGFPLATANTHTTPGARLSSFWRDSPHLYLLSDSGIVPITPTDPKRTQLTELPDSLPSQNGLENWEEKEEMRDPPKETVSVRAG